LVLEVIGVYTLSVKEDKSRAGKGELVRFAATLEPAAPITEYKFVFGDGNETGWITRSESSHAYGGSGSYLASVQARVGGSGQIISSESLNIRVGGISSGWIVAMAGIGGLGVGALLMRVAQKKRTPLNEREVMDPGHPTFLPKLDSGFQDVQESTEDSEPAVEIRLVNDAGIQTLEANEKAVGEGRKV